MARQTDVGYCIDPVGKSELLLDRVTDALREAIVSGELPAGARLSVPELARQLNVSRTPAREALIRLEQEGLISIAPRRGAMVLAGQIDDLAEIFQFREALEGMAARLASRRMTAETRDRLQAEFEAHASAVVSNDLSEHLEHDRKFHRCIADAAGNRRISAELEKVWTQLRLLTRTMSNRPGAVDNRIVEAHLKIFEALKAEDGRTAESAMRSHVRGILAFYQDVEPATGGF